MKCFFFNGTVPKEVRPRLIKAFKDKQSSCKVMLLTKKVGAFGLNLQAADRVIIWGAHWNPCVDMQAVGRSHRLGQTRPVTVYRLISEGLVSEKVSFRWAILDLLLTFKLVLLKDVVLQMYWRQLHKEGMIRDTYTEAQTVESYLSKDELAAFIGLANEVGESGSLQKFGEKCRIMSESQYGFLLNHRAVKYLLDHDRIYGEGDQHAFRGEAGTVHDWMERRRLEKNRTIVDEVSDGDDLSEDDESNQSKAPKITNDVL